MNKLTEKEGYVDYWKDKLEISQSAHKKLRHSILFMAGE